MQESQASIPPIHVDAQQQEHLEELPQHQIMDEQLQNSHEEHYREDNSWDDDDNADEELNEHYVSISQLHLEDNEDFSEGEEGYDGATAQEPSAHVAEASSSSVNPSVSTDTTKQPAENLQSSATHLSSETSSEPPTQHTIQRSDFQKYSPEHFKDLCHNAHSTLQNSPPSATKFIQTLYSLNYLMEDLLCDDSLENNDTVLSQPNLHYFIYHCVPFSIKFILQNKQISYDSISQSNNSTINEKMMTVYDRIVQEFSHQATAPNSQNQPVNNIHGFPETHDDSEIFILSLIQNYLQTTMKFLLTRRMNQDVQRNREHIKEIWRKNPFEVKVKDLQDVSLAIQTIELIFQSHYHFYENNGVYSKNSKLFQKDLNEYSPSSTASGWRTDPLHCNFATPKKKNRHFCSSYFLRNLNLFGQLGGFQLLIDILEHKEFTTPALMGHCLRVFQQTCPLLNNSITDELVPLCFESLQKQFEHLSDRQLRAFSFSLFEDLIKLLCTLADSSSSLSQKKNEYMDQLQLTLFFSCFSSKLVDARMKGLSQLKVLIKEVVERQNNPYSSSSSSNTSGPMQRSIDLRQLVTWLEEKKILSMITKGDLNLSLLQQSRPLLLFLGRFSSITSEDIDILWNAASGKHISLQQCTFNLILVIAQYLSLDTLNHIVHRFEETQVRHVQPHMLDFLHRFVAHSALRHKKQRLNLDVFWALMQDNQEVPAELSQKACGIIENLISRPEFEHQRKYLIQKCCENIRMNLSVTQTLSLLKNIISTFPAAKSKKKNSVWGVVDELNEKYGLIRILLDSLINFAPHSAHKPDIQVDTPPSPVVKRRRSITLHELIEVYKHPSEEQQRSSRYSVEKKIGAKLSFLTYLLKHSSTNISFKQCRSLWISLYEQMEDVSVRDIFIQWLKSTRSTISPSENILTSSVTDEFFEKIIKRISLQSLDMSTFSLFFSFLVSLNVQEHKIQSIHGFAFEESPAMFDDTSSLSSDASTQSPGTATSTTTPGSSMSSKAKSLKDRLSNFVSGGKKRGSSSLRRSKKITVKKFEILTNQLVGVDHLWSIVLEATDEKVCKTSINFLNDLHYEFAPHLKKLCMQTRRKHIKSCMSRIKSASSALNNPKCSQKEVHQRHIVRCLDVLLDYIHLHSKSHATLGKQDEEYHGSEQQVPESYSSRGSSNSPSLSDTLKLNFKYPTAPTPSFSLNLHRDTTLETLYTLIKKKIGKSVRLLLDSTEIPQDAVETLRSINMQNNQIVIIKVKESKKFGMLADTLSNALGIKKTSSLRPLTRGKGSSSSKRSSVSKTSSKLPQKKQMATFPVEIISENYFDLLVQLLKMQEDIGHRVWRLLQLLPLNQQIVSELENFPNEKDARSVSHLLSADSLYLLLYRLQIIDSFMKRAEATHRTEWKDAFISAGGIEHLIGILKGDSSLSRTFLHKQCFALILKTLNMLMEDASSYESHSKSVPLKTIVSSILDSSSQAIDFRIGRPRAASHHQGHIRLNSSDMTGMSPLATNPPAKIFEELASSSVSKKQVVTTGADHMVAQSIVCELMDLLTSCAKRDSNVSSQICQHPSMKSVIWNALVTFPNTEVREEMAECILEFTKAVQDSSHLIDHIVSFLFSKLNNIGPYEEQSRDYFFILEELIPLCSTDAEGSTACEKKEAEYLRVLIEKMLHRPIKEESEDDEDVVLVGLLRVITALIARHPTMKRGIGSEIDGAGLIKEIFFASLFDHPSEKKQKNAPPKCKSPASRTAAYELLVELITDCTENSAELHSLLGSYMRNSTVAASTNSLPWTYKPHHLSKSNIGYVGLRNLGATCYINSLMQQLFMTLPFREGLLSVLDYDHEKSDNHRVLYQMQKLFGFLQDSAKSWFDLDEFCKTYKDFEGNPIHPGRQQDANEFFNFLFDKIEDALRGTPKSNLLKDVFGGRLVNRTEYEIDGKPHVNNMEEIFYGMNLEVKHQNSILGSLKLINNGEMMKGDSAFFSDEHKKKVDAHRRTYIKKLPPVLIFHLKRFEFHLQTMTSTKLNDKIHFPETIDMFPYTVEGVAEDEEWENRDEFKKMAPNYYHYTLVGILVHSGSVNSGHYYSFIMDRSNPSHPWYEFNDCSLNSFDKSKLAEECFGGMEEVSAGKSDKGHAVSKKRVFRQNNAYMLFYQRTSTLHDSLSQINEEKLSLHPHVKIDDPEDRDTSKTMEQLDEQLNQKHAHLSTHWRSTMNAVHFLVKLSASKRQNQNSSSSNKNSQQLPMPTKIKDEVWKDNMLYFYHKNLFDHSFDKFLRRASHQCSFDSQSIQIYFFYVFHVVSHSAFYDKSFDTWCLFFEELLDQNATLSHDLLDFFEDVELMRNLVLCCPIALVRSATVSVLFKAVQSLSLANGIPPSSSESADKGENSTENALPQQSKETVPETDVPPLDKHVEAFIIECVHILQDINTYKPNSAEYFSLCYEIARLGPNHRQILLENNVLFELVQMLSSVDENYSLYQPFGKTAFSICLSLLALLVRALESSTSLKYRQKNSTKCPPTFLRNQPRGLELGQKERSLLFNNTFFARLVEQDVNTEAVVQILCHWCWENLQISINFGKLLISCVENISKRGRTKPLSERLEPVFKIFRGLLSLNDSQKSDRIFRILGELLDLLLDQSGSMGREATRLCLRFLLSMKQSNTVKSWINSRREDIDELCRGCNYKLKMT